MSDKIRGVIAVLVGLFALFQGFLLFEKGKVDWHLWTEVTAGIVLILLGVWRIRRQPYEAASDLLHK